MQAQLPQCMLGEVAHGEGELPRVPTHVGSSL
jgi:hypothetical protein